MARALVYIKTVADSRISVRRCGVKAELRDAGGWVSQSNEEMGADRRIR
jgi:hypothetical protein